MAPKNEEKKVTVVLNSDPFIKGEGSDTEFFSVNFKNYLIKVDEPVEVPESVAEVINNRNKARLAAKKFAAAHKFRDAQPGAV